LTGAASVGDAVGEGAAAGTAVPFCSTVGAYVVPHAAAASATSTRLARIFFISL
jgi:hypothetical protein